MGLLKSIRPQKVTMHWSMYSNSSDMSNKHGYGIHIKFEVSLHIWPIWPTVRHASFPKKTVKKLHFKWSSEIDAVKIYFNILWIQLMLEEISESIFCIICSKMNSFIKHRLSIYEQVIRCFENTYRHSGANCLIPFGLYGVKWP